MRTVIARRGLMGFPSETQKDPRAVWAEALAGDNGGRRTLYLHIPFCRSRCSFCPFYFGPATDSERAGYVRLLAKELKAKYKNTVLGYVWSLLMPLFQSLVFFVVFSLFLRFPIED